MTSFQIFWQNNYNHAKTCLKMGVPIEWFFENMNNLREMNRS